VSIKKLIRETKCLEKQIAQLTDKLQANKEKIQVFFDSKKIKTLEVEPGNSIDSVGLIATKTERIYIDYFVDRIQGKFDKEILDEILNKTYTIHDIKGLTIMLKKAGINPSEFKKFINVAVSPNREAIKRLFEMGIIKDLKGCYSAKVVKSIQIKEQKG
jgi:hypothetical protein